MPRKPLALAAALSFALLVPSAHAAIVPGQVIDGPSADIQRFGDLDMAPDGTGALTYVKKVSGIDHIFVSRFVGGTWRTPEEVDNGVTCDCSFPHVAVGNGGRTLVVFHAAGNVLRAALKSNGSSPFQFLDPDLKNNGKITYADVDMNPVTGDAYEISDILDSGNHVAAARLSGTTWTQVATADSTHNALDNNAANGNAGDSGAQTTARIAIDSAGNAVAVWPEGQNSVDQKVFARRITGANAAGSAVEMSVPTLAGHNRDNSNTDTVAIDGGGSSNPWIAFREQFTYGGNGRVRDLARELVGGSPSPVQVLDGLPLDTPTEGAEFPNIAINPSGQGLADLPTQMTSQVIGSNLVGGTWSTGFQVDPGVPNKPPSPAVAIADSGNGLDAWIDSNQTDSRVLARESVGGVLGPTITLSRAGDGGILSSDKSLVASSSAAGAVGVGFGQGNGGNNEIVAAVVDLPQPAPTVPPSNPIAKPAVSALRLSRTTFARGRKLATITRKHPVGTTISFSVSVQSSTTFSFAKRTKGFKAGKRCVARRPKHSKGKPKRCTRFVGSGSLRFSTAAGSHKVHFEGALSRRKRLKPGRYRLTVVSSNSAGKSAPKRANFTLLKK